MSLVIDGPSSNAWGAVLCDPTLVSHQGKLIAFAREEGVATGALYFQVLDVSASLARADAQAWNGWYRYTFPEQALVDTAHNDVSASEEITPELRLAGMDLITVTGVARPATPADASFTISSDGAFLEVYRQSTEGTLYLNRLMLLDTSEEVGGEEVLRYALEGAWEVRFRRSGVRDVPLDATDGPAYRDAVGVPFMEPTLELPEVSGITEGFDVTVAPTANRSVSVLYAVVSTPNAFTLHQIRRSTDSVLDYTVAPTPFPPLAPTLNGQALQPIPGLAPGITVYSEQEPAGADPTELPRQARLLVTLPVTGAGLDAALAVYDFGMDRDGQIAVLPEATQALTLVDGVLSDGVFTPDTSSPEFPTQENLASTVQLVGGLPVSTMLLGQVQPAGPLLLHHGDDGLVHLYYGGHDEGEDLPLAMVAQFDPRANRLVLAAPWSIPTATELPAGEVEFVARLTGSLMSGATVSISDVSFGGQPQDDLCTVSITYPEAVGLPGEVWSGVPRELRAFLDTLSGRASENSADPRVLSGAMLFFDFDGATPLARVPLDPETALPAGVFPQVLTLVGTRKDLPLTTLTVASDGNGGLNYTFAFQGPNGSTTSTTWASVPVGIAQYPDLFDGVAASSTYAYPADANQTPMFGLPTSSPQSPLPLLLVSDGTNNAQAAATTITLTATSNDQLQVSFQGAYTATFNAPSDVQGFVDAVNAQAGFSALGLCFLTEGVAGAVLPTSGAVGPMDLATTSALFDLVMPPQADLDATPRAGTYNAGTQSHTFAEDAGLSLLQMAGFTAHATDPENSAPAYVQNLTSTEALATSTRSLRAAVDEEDDGALSSGAWIRRDPQIQCSFSGTDQATVPIASHGALRPHAINLQPQNSWTFEAWVRPDVQLHQRLATFHDGVTPIGPGMPTRDYTIALEAQQVQRFQSYDKTPGTPDSSFFQCNYSAQASFMPSEEFTWEFWVRPQDQAAPDGLMGGIIQLGQQEYNPFLSVALSSDRRLTLITNDEDNQEHTYTLSDALPSGDADQAWSHVALVGYQSDEGTWRIIAIINGDEVEHVDGVSLQQQSQPGLVIGRSMAADVSVFGQIAQLRYWLIARSASDIQRTRLVSMTGYEPGLAGCWPLSALQEQGGINYAQNTSFLTGSGWDATQQAFKQPMDNPNDSYFLSTVATVGGLPTVEANTLLANTSWNHLAITYQAGGALLMNPAARYELGEYDWVNCGVAENVAASGTFSIDAWVRIESTTLTGPGTLLARWAPPTSEDQCYRLWIDSAGELHLDIVVIADNDGDVTTLSGTSSGAGLVDGETHHVAVVFDSTRGDGDTKTASWEISFYVDGAAAGGGDGTLADMETVEIMEAQTPLLLGRAFLAPDDAPPMAAEDFSFYRGTLGEVRFWSAPATLEQLFPERYPRTPVYGTPRGLSGQWSFQEQSGMVARDALGEADAKLSSSAMWSSLSATSTMKFIANGAPIGIVTPYTGTLETTSVSQFTLGTPTGTTNTTGFTGDIAEVTLWNTARSLEEIQDQQYIPIEGSEAGLLAAWSFDQGSEDLTGGQNDFLPEVASTRLSVSSAPISDEGPYVLNVYGGARTEQIQHVPGRLAVGAYADARDVGLPSQRGVLKRQYLLDPNQTLTRPLQIGDLDLVYIGQTQTDPTLIGYIEGAPPVPSENLTRPYYTNPAGAPYVKYLDTSTVTLNQEATRTLGFQSSRAQATQLDVSGAFGITGIKSYQNINIGVPPFSISTSSMDQKGIAQLKVQASSTFGSDDGESVSGDWISGQSDTMGLSGDWEAYQSDPSNYLNPTVGRRFVADNLGYALVESLTADLYALTFRATQVAVGTLALPNPNIPPDRNIILFPMRDDYTRATTLDGKVGLVNDPSYPAADIRRGSFFKPEEAYRLEAEIQRAQQRAESFAAQFNASGRAHAGDTDLDDAAGVLPQDFSVQPGDAAVLATPTQGLVNRFVWTADGGLHVERQASAASTTQTYGGSLSYGGGGGMHADGQFFYYFGFEWSLDLMATHKVDVHVGSEDKTAQSVGLDVQVEGEAYLRAFDPTAPGEYGGTGAYLPGAAAGKVKAYRFMTIYLPPSSKNSAAFEGVVDQDWIMLSNSPMARALRDLDVSNPTWRILHRVTYVERVPPPISSRPFTSPVSSLQPPVNLEGNAALISLVHDQLATGSVTQLKVGDAVAAVLNPAPTAPGQYPASVLEGIVPWWAEFLARARPDSGGTTQDPDAAKLLQTLMNRTTKYMYQTFATDAYADITQR